MSEPDSNSAASITVSPSITTATETPTTVTNTVRAPPSHPFPAPPPYRAIAPIHRPNPFQQAYNHLFSQTQNPNPTHNPYHLDPTSILYPYAPPGQGFSTRPVGVSSPFVAQTSVMAGSHSGYPPPPPIFPYGNLAPNQMVSMMQQFLTTRNPQIHQVPRVGSGSSVKPGPKRGRARQRVAPPPSTSNRDTSRSNNARSQDPAVVLVRGRKVRITEGATLNSLCRSWLGNGVALGGIQMQMRENTMRPLPKPLPAEAIRPLPNDTAEEPTDEDKEDKESVKDLSEKDLLKRHIERAKKVRARLKQERLRKIARYKDRLILLLPKSEEEEEEEEGKKKG